MPKTKISEFSTNPALNTDIDGINTGEGMLPSDVNNALRELMSQLKNQQAGLDGDNFTVGGNLAVTGTTTLATSTSGVLKATSGVVAAAVAGTDYQAPLVSGTNIKTVNSTSLLGSGNVAVQEVLVSGTNIKTVGGTSILGSGDIAVTAAVAGGAIYENANSITANYTLSTNKNALSAGPITISSGVTVTVPSGQRWVIV